MVSLAVNFRRSVIIAELWRSEVARPGNVLSNFAFFFGKMTPYGNKFQNSVPKVFTASLIDAVVFKCRKICPTGNREIVHYLTDKKQNFGCLSNCRYCADRAQNLPVPAPSIWLTMIQISSKSVHFPNAWRPFFCLIEYFHDRLSQPRKMETRHPVEGSFVVNFWRSVIIAELWRLEF